MSKLERIEYRPEIQQVEESLYTLGNGYLGIRGCFEEGYPSGDTIRGCYINGTYERVPMMHAEMAYGFPTVQDKQPRVMDIQTINVYLDGEPARLLEGHYEAYHRMLAFETGESVRRYRYITCTGTVGKVCFRRLVSQLDRHLAVFRVEIDYDGQIEVRSLVDGNVENYSNRNDPRTGQGHTKLTSVISVGIDRETISLALKTQSTEIEVAALVEHRIFSEAQTFVKSEVKGTLAETHIVGRGCLTVEKWCVLSDSLRVENPQLFNREHIKSLAEKTYEMLIKEQQAYYQDIRATLGIEVRGDETVNQALQFMQFQLMQSVGRDAYSNVSAKGLSGEGYEGHYFWDTEIYILPVLIHTQPERAKALLDYRHRILPYAKERALKLGHRKGAKYAWRTISGIECSGYFPAGTAQYHINADIAYAFLLYYQMTDDLKYMLDKGFEVLLETARIWMDMGHFKEGVFMIQDVTGPDEYTAVVNNNYYTNVMAKYHLEWVVKLDDIFQNSSYSGAYKSLRDALLMDDSELSLMKIASETMFLPYDEKRQFYAQDDSFLSKPVWPFENPMYQRRPLLLHYHPLCIYRHQVLKQADTILAHMLLEQYAEPPEICNAFDYYEQITTHDSSLSSCIYGIMASRCGMSEKAYRYFMESVKLDLENTHGNTKDGLHMANIAGALMSIIYGFGGFRVIEGKISLRPQLPEKWDSYVFSLIYKKSILKVEVGESVFIRRLSGEPVDLILDGQKMTI